jgi:hypothetical protein
VVTVNREALIRRQTSLPNLMIPTDLFQKFGMFSVTTSQPSIHHVFTSIAPRFVHPNTTKNTHFSQNPTQKHH